MDAERKDVIVKEINYWKSHHLLPEQYCDFLIALYTEGEGTEESQTKSKKTPYYLLFYFFNTLLLIMPMLIYLLVESVTWQIIGILLVLLSNMWMIGIFKKNEQLNEGYAVMTLLVNFLISTSLYLNDLFKEVLITYAWIFINSISWIVFGKWKNHFFLQVAGVFVFIIACILTGFYYF
ncbi:hypothetical protein SAMN04487944_101510 [Gracilibacillus ureilyticus]|uniref:Uncharacterized protein n=1 Tax=Gracilibacillus ureilyticus TaxID=531814 RepID=A0A1H9M1I8_9BACI|nr:hypothetical protein [Gracilibacillus ureilyticus]SER17556.1 hypothetical protein SAMN04487944_101510 [Gracilibacillus ureilyticus]